MSCYVMILYVISINVISYHVILRLLALCYISSYSACLLFCSLLETFPFWPCPFFFVYFLSFSFTLSFTLSFSLLLLLPLLLFLFSSYSFFLPHSPIDYFFSVLWRLLTKQTTCLTQDPSVTLTSSSVSLNSSCSILIIAVCSLFITQFSCLSAYLILLSYHISSHLINWINSTLFLTTKLFFPFLTFVPLQPHLHPNIHPSHSLRPAWSPINPSSLPYPPPHPFLTFPLLLFLLIISFPFLISLVPQGMLMTPVYKPYVKSEMVQTRCDMIWYDMI